MKVVILAGGKGTRIIEETINKPKPMIEIGNKPIIWHIMKTYAHYGFDDFIICSGYKKEILQNYFKNISESWKVLVEDTGINTMTGGRLKRIQHHVENESFCFTYGDTLNNLNIIDLVDFHKKNKKIATVTACQPPEKYGILELNENLVCGFKEKPVRVGEWVNGGFFVLEPEIFNYIENDSTVWEQEPMKNLSNDQQLTAFKHIGYYQPMDTLSDKFKLENLWNSENPPWKVWK
jgi:glucose-1-phosphate cytidylyltransferase